MLQTGYPLHHAVQLTVSVSIMVMGCLPYVIEFLPADEILHLFHTINHWKRKAPAALWTTGAREDRVEWRVYGICIPNV
jgi:hypothetical protein